MNVLISVCFFFWYSLQKLGYWSAGNDSFNISLPLFTADEAATLVRVSPAVISLLLGEPLLIEVSASGGYSEITWMRNGAALSGTFVSHDEVYYRATSSMADLGEYSITAAPGGPTVTVVVLEAGAYFPESEMKSCSLQSR